MEIDVDDYELERNLSASRVKTHNTCPLQYAFGYIQEDPRKKPSEGYMEMGSAVHDTIEKVWGDNLDTRDAGILSHRFKEHYRSVENPDIPKYLYERGLDSLESAARFIEKEHHVEIREIEMWHEYRISRQDFSRNFTAKIDVIANGEIWDWKTGAQKVKDGKKLKKPKYREEDEIIQGAIYAGAYYNKYGEYPNRVRFIYLKDSNITNLDVDKPAWDKMIAYAKSLQSSLESGSFRPKTGGHCGFCDYQFICPAQDVSMANVTYEKY